MGGTAAACSSMFRPSGGERAGTEGGERSSRTSAVAASAPPMVSPDRTIVAEIFEKRSPGSRDDRVIYRSWTRAAPLRRGARAGR